MNIYVNLWSYLTQLFLEWEIFETEVEQKIKQTHFVSSIFLNRTFLR
jgi:hypothetical protein